MTQPKYRLIANLGDTSPLDYGGYFIYKDTTGIYDDCAELLVLDNEEDEKTSYTIYRFDIDRCILTNGVLSDNEFHPELPVWFGTRFNPERPQDGDHLQSLADDCGDTVEDLQAFFCSEDPCVRARAYQAVGDYWGWENFDSDPLHMTRSEVRKRYASYLRRKRPRKKPDYSKFDAAYFAKNHTCLIEHNFPAAHPEQYGYWQGPAVQIGSLQAGLAVSMAELDIWSWFVATISPRGYCTLYILQDDIEKIGWPALRRMLRRVVVSQPQKTALPELSHTLEFEEV